MNSLSSLIENFNLALSSLLGNKVRAILTMLGIIIGVAAVVVLLSLGQGVQGAIRKQFEQFRIDQITIFAQENEAGKFRQLTTELVNQVQDDLVKIGRFRFMSTYLDSFTVKIGTREQTLSVTGVSADYLTFARQNILAGRFFSEAEASVGERVALLGKTTFSRMFPPGTPPNAVIGQYVRFSNASFQILGVMDVTPGDNSLEGNNYILVPLITAQTRLNSELVAPDRRPVTFLTIQIDQAENIPAIVERLNTLLRTLRRVPAGAVDDFFVLYLGSFLDTFNSIIGGFTAFLGVTAGISLVVGGIGVMNIMLVTVTERTREIGLRKAVGAQIADIILQFLIEAVTITVVAGLIGVALALSLVAIAGTLTPFQIGVQPSSIAIALGVSASIGIFFGIYPAQRAAALSVIDALRFE